MKPLRADKIEVLTLAALKPARRNARTHSKRQLKQISASIDQWGFTNPVLIDEENVIVAGHGRVAAAKQLGLTEVPCIRLANMTDADKRAYAIADNVIATKSGWDKETLAIELGELVALNFDVSLTGLELPEIDQFLADATEADCAGPTREDDPPKPPPPAEIVTRPGDVWVLGAHRLVCGDAKSETAMQLLMGPDRADMVFCDPPYNLRIEGVVTGAWEGAPSGICGSVGGADLDGVHGLLEDFAGEDGGRVPRRGHPLRVHGLAPHRRAACRGRGLRPRPQEPVRLG